VTRGHPSVTEERECVICPEVGLEMGISVLRGPEFGSRGEGTFIMSRAPGCALEVDLGVRVLR